MNKELLQKKLSRTANQYFIDEFKGAYPVDEMGNILEAFKAGAKEILDNPELYGLMKVNEKGNCSLCNGTGNMPIDRDVSEYYKDEN